MSTHAEIEVTFVIADLAGFTALTETHGSLHALHVVTRYVEMVREALEPGARLAERVGDAVLIVAADSPCAVRTAVRLREAAAHERLFPKIRAGIHGGPVDRARRELLRHGAQPHGAARRTRQAGPDPLHRADRVDRRSSRERAVPEPGSGAAQEHRPPGRGLPDRAGAPPQRHHARRPRLPHAGEPRAAPARLRLGGRTHYFCSLACAKAFADHPDQAAPR